MIRLAMALLTVSFLASAAWSDDPDAAKRIADLERRVAASQTFDYDLHNGLRHEYHYAGKRDLEIEQCDIILKHLPMHGYTLDCMGAREENKQDAIDNLAAVVKEYPEYVHAATACRVKIALLNDDPLQRERLLYPLRDIQDPTLNAYLKIIKDEYVAVVPATRRVPENKRLRVLLAMDTDSDLNTDHGFAFIDDELDKFQEVLGEIRKGREERISIDVLKGAALTPDGVLDYYRQLPMEAGDAILFFYAGHGGWDTTGVERDGRRIEKGHFLAMKHGSLLRYELVDAILARKPNAAFVLSEACSNIGTFNIAERRRPAEWLGFRDLFFFNAGLFNITAATRTEVAYCGEFTSEFLMLLCEPRSAIRPDGLEAPIGWVEFHNALIRKTQEHFARDQKAEHDRGGPKRPFDIRDSKPYTPQAIDLGYWPWVRCGNIPAGLWPQLGHPAGHRMIPNCVALSPDGDWSQIYGHGGHSGGGDMADAVNKQVIALTKDGKHAKHVAFGEKGQWGLVTSDNDILGEKLADSLQDDVIKLRNNKVSIESLALGPDDSWAVVISGPGGTAVVSDGLPKELVEALDDLGKQRARIQDVALSPTGGWVVLYGDNGYIAQKVPEPLLANLQAYSKAGYRFHTVALGPDDGWLLVYRP